MSKNTQCLHFLVNCGPGTMHDVSTRIFQAGIFGVQLVSSQLKSCDYTRENKQIRYFLFWCSITTVLRGIIISLQLQYIFYLFSMETKLFSYLVTPIHFQIVFGFTTGGQLIACVAQTFRQSCFHSRDRFQLL